MCVYANTTIKKTAVKFMPPTLKMQSCNLVKILDEFFIVSGSHYTVPVISCHDH